MTNGRIWQRKVELDSSDVQIFFSNRSKIYSEENPLVSVLYQDDHPDLARERDVTEKTTLLPLLGAGSNDRVLDVGCGIGRWADVLAEKVHAYHGVDIDDGMINIAKKRHKQNTNVSFQALPAQQINLNTLTAKAPFSLLVMIGIMMYLNDNECKKVICNVLKTLTLDARILIREPVGIKERLTLKNVWSDEMKCEYSAIYRTIDEIMGILETSFKECSYKMVASKALYPDHLNNRSETRQHYLIYQMMGDKKS